MVAVTFRGTTYSSFKALVKKIRTLKKLRLSSARKALVAAFFTRFLEGHPVVTADTIFTLTNEYNCVVFRCFDEDENMVELSVSKAAWKHDQ